jgi:hypothetical protein
MNRAGAEMLACDLSEHLGRDPSRYCLRWDLGALIVAPSVLRAASARNGHRRTTAP